MMIVEFEFSKEIDRLLPQSMRLNAVSHISMTRYAADTIANLR